MTLVVHSRVLLLNGSSWEPLAVITVIRAINLLLSEKAIVVEESGKYLSTIREKIAVPSVIALKNYIKVPRRYAHWSRKGVLVRDKYTCIYCGVFPGSITKGKLWSKGDFTVDHIVPRCRGGKHTWTNTACACRLCNHRKGARSPSEIGMKLKWEPKMPQASYLMFEMNSAPDTWQRYVSA